MQIGVSGHQDRTGIAWSWVARSVRSELANLQGVSKVLSSLATGSDQVFACAAIDLHIPVVAVLPVEGYERYFKGRELANYQLLLEQCEVIQLTCKGDPEHAFFNAGKFVVDNTEMLFAIWDGQAAEGLGGTADIVSYALTHSRKIIHLNPITQEVIVI